MTHAPYMKQLLILTLGAMSAVFRFKIGMIPDLLACSAPGILYYLATGQVQWPLPEHAHLNVGVTIVVAA